MELKAYFENTRGIGVLATADSSGKVDAAIYARPHVMDDGSVAFIMLDRLTHANLQSNPHAAYLFLERSDDAKKYEGIRLFLTKTGEETDAEKIHALRRRLCPEDEQARFLVYFKVDKVLPLIGAGRE
ncbi:MAG: pyridoxamine 5'-phosphate oxidase family protein [Candidatus Sumerlaeia bacterium]|nr:pyridoxamine 5'-phosphate oxidase family protein [Candidatus Sumerlaeia bacterium]